MTYEDQTTIVSGPIPDEYGNATFVVMVGDRRVEAIATPDGAGVSEQDFDVSGPVFRAISDFRKGKTELLLSCLREAAEVRRASGHSSGLDAYVPANITVGANPDVRGDCVFFAVTIGAIPLEVLVTRDGAIVDDYDPVAHPNGELELEALTGARRAVLNLVLAHPERAALWGLDCELLDLFWN